MDSKDLPTLNGVVDKLMTHIVQKQEDLRRAEAISGRGWNPRKCNRLREEIASLEHRLRLAEKLQESALSSPQ